MAARTLLLPTATGDPRVVRYDDGTLSARGRGLAWILATLLLIGGVGVLAAAGITPTTGGSRSGAAAPSAAPTGDPAVSSGGRAAGAGGTATSAVPAAETAAGAIVAEWDGPTVHVDWTGRTYRTVEADFVGDRVAVPGDRVSRTLTLRNDGPSDAVLTVALAVGQDLPAGTANPDLAQAVDLFWDVAGVTGAERFATLLDRPTPTVAEVAVPRGGTARITLGFELPADTTAHLNAATDSTALTFRVEAQMQGDTTVTPRYGVLAVTGSQVLGVVLVVVGLLLAGWLLLLIARRRRRCADCGRPAHRRERD
jgi:hypothetical protein